MPFRIERKTGIDLITHGNTYLESTPPFWVIDKDRNCGVQVFVDEARVLVFTLKEGRTPSEDPDDYVIEQVRFQDGGQLYFKKGELAREKAHIHRIVYTAPKNNG